jgi:hypothetical protein
MEEAIQYHQCLCTWSLLDFEISDVSILAHDFFKSLICETWHYLNIFLGGLVPFDSDFLLGIWAKQSLSFLFAYWLYGAICSVLNYIWFYSCTVTSLALTRRLHREWGYYWLFLLAMSLECLPTSWLSLPAASRKVIETLNADKLVWWFAQNFGLIIIYLSTLLLGTDEVNG